MTACVCLPLVEELYPKVGYLLSLGQIRPGSIFGQGLPELNANTVWSFGPSDAGSAGECHRPAHGTGEPLLIKARYGEPILTRIYNDLPVDWAIDGCFGRNASSVHLHNS